MSKPSPTQPYAYMETGARRIGRIRRQGADRQRRQRERWRDAGRPDPATLDRAIVDALRDLILEAPDGQRLASAVDPQRVIRRTAGYLVERSRADHEAGRDVTVYRIEQVSEALTGRLLQRKKRRVTV